MTLPAGWVSTTIGEALEIVRGISFPKDAKTYEPREGYVACLRTANVQQEVEWGDLWYIPSQHIKRNEQYVQSYDILISTANSLELVGKVAQIKNIPSKATLGAFISLIRVPDNLNAKFIYFLLSSPEIQLRIHKLASTTTNISNISTGKLKTVSIPIPPLVEQERIVERIEDLFTQLDAGVAGLKRVQAALKRYRASVLKAACEGRLVPQDPADEPAEELLKRILTEKGENVSKVPAPDGDLPELPKGWVWASIEQLTYVGTGATPLRNKAIYYEQGTIPWVTSGALNQLFVDEAEEYITELALKETNAKIFPVGSLLVAMYGEGKTRGKVSELRISAATNQACAGLVFEGLSAECKPYVKVFFQNNYEDIRRLSSGGVQPNLNLTIIKKTLLPLPPLAEQHRIVAEVERRLSVAQEVEATVSVGLRRAARLRQAILKRAFEGRLV